LHGGADIKAAYAMALAEYTPAAEDVLTPTYAAALAELQRIYGPSARAHYRVVRDRFNTTAKAFASCAKLVDPGVGADNVIGDSHALEAWKDAAVHAAALDDLVEVVAAAAELVRGPAEPSGLGISAVPFLLPLLVGVDGVHKRRAYEAWMDAPEQKTGPLTTPTIAAQPAPEPTRCGKWCRLHRIGAPIRAIDDPTGVEMYGPPQPIGVRQTQPAPVGTDVRKPTWERFDPEDDQVTPRRPLARLRASLARRQPEPANLLDTVLTSEGDDQHDD
jgi:hypothetical protein